MFNTGNCPSVPIVANLDGNNGNNWNDGSWLWFLIVVFAIFGGWGNGFGGFGGTNGGVGSEIQRGFDNQAVVSKLDGISNGLCDGFYAMNNSMLTGFNGINTNIMQTGYGIQQAVNADTVANMQNTKLTAHFAKKLSVKGNSEKAEQAREYFTTVEERVKQKAIDISQLSPELKMFNTIFQSVAQQQLEQKRQAEQINKVEQTVDNMKEIFTQPIGDWKAEINARVREISIKSKIDYQILYNQLYGELETTAHCSLKRLQDNKKKRMEKAGNTKTAIKNETTKIAIIFEKPQLKAIFENIVKKYAMSYCA